MRITYESENDRMWQLGAADKVSARLFLCFGDNTVTNEAKYSKHDFTLKVRKWTAIAEYKRRTHKFGTYPDVTLSEPKWTYLRSFNGPAFIIFEFTDDIYVGEVRHMPPLIANLSGRTKNTRDQWDVHMCVQVPLEFLVPLNKWIPNILPTDV